MRFKTDENLPIEVPELLRQHKHDALSVQDQQMAGQGDPRVALVCQVEGRALVTCDLDFADIRAYPPENYHGIIVRRPAVQSVSSLLRLMNLALPLIDVEPTRRVMSLILSSARSSPPSPARYWTLAITGRYFKPFDRLTIRSTTSRPRV